MGITFGSYSRKVRNRHIPAMPVHHVTRLESYRLLSCAGMATGLSGIFSP